MGTAVALTNLGDLEGTSPVNMIQFEGQQVYLEPEINSEHFIAGIVGKSAALQRVLEQVAIVAPTDSTVLLRGEAYYPAEQNPPARDCKGTLSRLEIFDPRRSLMNTFVQVLVKHGYSSLFASVFVCQKGLPVPAILFLMAAGGLAGSGRLSLGVALGPAVIAIHERRRKTSTPSAPDLRSTNYIKSSAAHSGEHSHG